MVCAAGRPSFEPQGRYDRSSSFHDDVDHRATKVRPEDYDFPFENLVFEGGGNKGLAYCGAVRVSRIHRAQSSLGSGQYSLGNGQSSLGSSQFSPGSGQSFSRQWSVFCG